MDRREGRPRRNIVPFVEWDAKTEDERRAELAAATAGQPRFIWSAGLASASLPDLERFVAGMLNVVGPREGRPGGTDAETGEPFPPAGVPGTFYALVREGVEVELGPTIALADPVACAEVVGRWAL